MFDSWVMQEHEGLLHDRFDDTFDDDGLLAVAGAAADTFDSRDPAEWTPEWPGGDIPEPTYATTAPSGWLALELDTGTDDPTMLTDEALVEAAVGFDRVSSWASARQARVIAELARRRPRDTAPHTARWACAGSEFVPDEVGVALRLARGTAAARVNMACRLLTVLPSTFALWEAGRIDTSKARAVHDATVVLSDELAAAVQARVLPRAPEQPPRRARAAWSFPLCPNPSPLE